MKLKVCGMRDGQNIKDLLSLKPDFIGFIFYEKSPRFVGDELDADLLKVFPSEVKKVGVFVNAELNEVKSKVDEYALDYVQLHGDESVEYVADLFAVGIKVIKVFSVGEDFDFEKFKGFNPFVDFFLFDTKTEDRGGSGKKFNWELLKDYQSEVPYFLSGGIDVESVTDSEVLKRLGPYALDVNSKFELEPGLKSINQLAELKVLINE